MNSNINQSKNTGNIAWDLVIARYGEIGLKSEIVRKNFTSKLISNIKWSLRIEGFDEKEFNIRRTRGRIFIQPEETGDANAIEKILDALSYVFGVVSYSPCIKTRSEFDSMVDAALTVAKKPLSIGGSFAVSTNRVGKHDFGSMDVNRIVGDAIRKKFDSEVDLDDPDHTIYLDVRNEDAYVFNQKINGLGGLPISSQGKLVSLFSGGIDSPVASAMMMKRGANVVPIFIYKGSKKKEEKKRAVKSAQRLSRYSPNGLKMYVVNLKDFFDKISSSGGKHTCVICKRGMYRVAEKIANRIGAHGVITGGNLGQVASQTLKNLHTLDCSIELPVYRPVIGLDKIEIEKMSRNLGLYEISSKDVGGCPVLPDDISTASSIEKVEEIEEKEDLKAIVEKATKNIEEIDIRPKTER